MGEGPSLGTVPSRTTCDAKRASCGGEGGWPDWRAREGQPRSPLDVGRSDMLCDPPRAAATAAAAAVLAFEGGLMGVSIGGACYAVVCAVWLAWEVIRAFRMLSHRIPVVPWRPNLMFNVYARSRRNLLERVSGRMRRMAQQTGVPHVRAFGVVVGKCPFVHIGGASLARAALHNQPVKAPLYHAFKAFAGEGIFTAEGKDWSDKRGEVLQAFAQVGLEPLAAASMRAARRLTDEIDARHASETATDRRQKGKEGDGKGAVSGEDVAEFVLELLPLLQRATLRATFEYLTGVPIETAVEEETEREKRVDETSDKTSDPAAAWEDEYLTAATALRHLIPARARSVWMASDWLYGLSPVGRLEARSIRNARRLPAMALRVARPGSPLAVLAESAVHGGGKRRDGPSKALLDEAVTLLFAGHDTQSATLSWALLRLAEDSATQEELRASILAKPDVASTLGLDDLLLGGTCKTGEKKHGCSRECGAPEPTAGNKQQPAWRTSAGAPFLEAVLREVLRLHPVAPLVVRRMTSDAVDGSVTLPEGCAAGVWLHAVHRDEAAWEKPEAFSPYRWLMTQEEWGREQALRRSLSDDRGEGAPPARYAAEKPDTRTEGRAGAGGEGDGYGGKGLGASAAMKVRFKGAAFMPFATGPRACAGQHLAWVFMRIVLARLVCQYTILPPVGEVATAGGDDALTPSVGFTVTPANAACVKLAPRPKRG